MKVHCWGLTSVKNLLTRLLGMWSAGSPLSAPSGIASLPHYPRKLPDLRLHPSWCGLHPTTDWAGFKGLPGHFSPAWDNSGRPFQLQSSLWGCPGQSLYPYYAWFLPHLTLFSLPLHSCWSQELSLLNILLTKLCLRICFRETPNLKQY